MVESPNSIARAYPMPPATPIRPPANASVPPSNSNSRRTCFGVNPSASNVPTSVARCSMPNWKSSAISNSAATIRKKLNPRNSPPKSCDCSADFNARSRTGSRRKPNSSGGKFARRCAVKFLMAASAETLLGTGQRRAVRSPKRLAHIFWPAASVMNAFGVPRYFFQ